MAKDKTAEPKDEGHSAVKQRDEGGVTVYSCGDVDLLRYKAGEQHYRCLVDVPGQGLEKGKVYDLSPPDFDASLGHVAANLAATAGGKK